MEWAKKYETAGKDYTARVRIIDNVAARLKLRPGTMDGDKYNKKTMSKIWWKSRKQQEPEAEKVQLVH